MDGRRRLARPSGRGVRRRPRPASPGRGHRGSGRPRRGCAP